MNEELQKQIENAIGSIIDPDLNLSLSDLKAIDSIVISGSIIQVNCKLTPPIHWVYSSIKQEISNRLSEIAPDHSFEIFITPKEVDIQGRQFLKEVTNIIAVASGKGGVGKSSIAANLATALSLKGAKVGILDGDVYGPSQPTMFGLVDEQLGAIEMPDGKTFAVPNERYDIKIASMGFLMKKNEAAVLRGPMLAGYFSMLFEQVEWGELDFLIFDLPPGTGDIQLTLTQKIPLTGAVVVTTPQEIALADVRRAIAMFRKVNVDVLGVVENMSYFIPPDMPDKKYHIFGKGGGKSVADEYGVNLLGEVPLDISLRENHDTGMPPMLNREDSVYKLEIEKMAAKTVSEVRRINNKKQNRPNIKISL